MPKSHSLANSPRSLARMPDWHRLHPQPMFGAAFLPAENQCCCTENFPSAATRACVRWFDRMRLFTFIKRVLPNRPVSTRVWRGPFRGARIVMNPRDSLRKIFGLYEHELNAWLEQALRRVSRVVDVGANDGYFTFGSAAAFRRLGKTGEIIACEPQDSHVAMLRESVGSQPETGIRFEIVHALVGKELKPGMITLDSLRPAVDDSNDKVSTLVKIDVEGAEVDVIAGGQSWLQPSNPFV